MFCPLFFPIPAAFEAVRAALISGFEALNYHRIEAAINLDNQASVALAMSLGMQKECIRRGFCYEQEQWADQIIYVALPSDFGLIDAPPVELEQAIPTPASKS